MVVALLERIAQVVPDLKLRSQAANPPSADLAGRLEAFYRVLAAAAAGELLPAVALVSSVTSRGAASTTRPSGRA